jgi:Zn-dependent M28 family amino/carboxypeptidase
MDEIAGVDLRGAIAVYFSTAPDSLDAATRARFASTTERWRTLREAGAIGTITIANPRTAEIPWSRSSAQRLQPYTSPADSTLDEYRGQQVAITMNPAHAELLFEGSGHTYAELLALDEGGKSLGAFPLTTRADATIAATRAEVDSENVAGVLRGRDPARRDEFVVVSAHLDHLGTSPTGTGDRIYNGAMDNASGVAAVLEAAARFHDAAERPARSLLFLTVTGEEHGELGSRYFVEHPTVPRAAIVANLNTDMFLPLFPLRQLMALGLDESNLSDDARAAARRLGIGVQADPEPGRNRFTRSDQYSFVRAGIPALGLKVGYDPESPEAEAVRTWMTNRYHGVSDDLSQPVNLEAAGLFVRALEELARHVADRPDRPAWNDRSVFKRLAAARQ